MKHTPFIMALLAGSALALATPAAAAAQHHHNPPPPAHPNARWNRGNVHVNVRVAPFRFHNRVVVRLAPAERWRWTHGRWHHGWHHGRFGWWWWAGGAWYFYDVPVYPYPAYVSDVYYDAEPASGGAYWYWCNDPRGYYPYVQTCNGPWQPVPAGAGPEQGGPNMGAAPSDNDENGPPPGYDNGQNGPPAGYQGQNPDDENGPPPGYGDNDQNGPPAGYGDQDQGPPQGYGNGPDDQDQGDDNGDNAPDDQNGPPPGDQNGPPPGYGGSPQ